MKKTEIFDNRIGTTSQLIDRLARQAAGLPDEHRALFAEAIEQLRTSLEELQVAGEELSQQAEELAEARLAAEEERQRYLGLFAYAPDAYLVTDAEGLIVEANERAGTLLRVASAALVRKPLSVFVDKTDRKAFYAQMDRLAETARREDWEIYLRPRGGKPFSALVDATAIPARGGGIAGFRWLIRDATEAKNREIEARLATFPELNPEPVIEADASGHIYYINPSARRVFPGLPRDGADHPWLSGIAEAAARLRRSRRRSVTGEMQVDDRWFLRTIWLAKGESRVRIYGREITDRKRAEERLRASEQRYRELVDNANSIIIRWKSGGEITYANRFARSFFGYSADEFVGRDVRTLIPQTDSSGRDQSELAGRIAASPGTFASNENENVLKDGSRVWVQWTNRALLDDSGSVREILAIGNDVTGLKRAEEGLREARDYLDSLINYANAPIIVWDPRSRITRFNHAFEDLTGLKAEQVIGRDIGLIFPEEQRTECLGLIQGATARGERWEAVEIPILGCDGAVRTVLWNSANILCPDGKTAVATIAQGQDITDRKRMEEALLVNQAELEDRVAERTAELARSSELLERMFDSVDLAIASMDGDFGFIRVNKAFADAFGGAPADYAGKDLSALHPEAGVEAVFRRVLETGEPHTEFEGPFPGGSPAGQEGRFWDWRLQRVAGGGGLVLSLVDVTARVKSEEERRRLAAAVRQSSEGIVITDREDRVLYVNRTFEELHGLSRADVLGRPYGDILAIDKEPESFRKGLRESVAQGEVWKGRLTRSTGGLPERKLDVTISPVRDPGGAIVNFAILERDVTHEHRLEASVRQLQKLDALGSLAGGIAHDFNNILVPIFINAELAAFDAEKDGPLARYLDLILEAAKRGRELVKQIISFSKPSELKREAVDIVPVVRETAQFLRASIPSSIVILERFGLPSAAVRADPTQLHQVLMNLGNNAAHAMRDKGGRLDLVLSAVEVSAEMAAQNPELRPGPYIKMMVADTGTGMTPEVREKIFDPFFTTKRRGEGTGMGLTVAHGIVKGHGGAITVDTAPGRGTTFEVYIPAASGEAAPARAGMTPLPKGQGRVLFIDDEDMLARTVPPMLARLGYTVTAQTDPVEALRLFQQDPGRFDLVITDETMPRLTGEKLAREMLRIRPDLPVILATGFSEAVDEAHTRALGIRAFIMKPFSMAEIAEKIRDALKRT